MKTIVIIGGIVLLGASVIAIVQNDRKSAAAPKVHSAFDSIKHTPELPSAPSSTPALNPAHGLSGHRCDLPVGASLGGAAVSPAPASIPPPVINMNPSPPQPSSPAPAAVPGRTSTGLKVNPAHGVPGHRCDIQVGAPLT